jgi:hypothetical protein
MPERDERGTEGKSLVTARQRKKHRRTKRIAKLYKRLNQPLSVTVLGGIIVFLITSFVQQQYAKSQREFEIEQAKRTHRIELASTAENQIIQELSKRFTGIAVVAGAYAGHYGKEQYRENVDYYNDSKREWDREQEVLELKVGVYFPDPGIQKSWNSLVKRLDNFDTNVVGLNDRLRGVTTDSQELKKALSPIDKTIENIEIDLKNFAHQLNEFINHEEVRPLRE